MNKQITENRQGLDSLLFVGANQIVSSQAVSSGQSSDRVFIPITDDIIYDHPEQIKGPLVPYFAGMECRNWLSIELNPDEEMKPLSSNDKPVSPEIPRAIPKPSLEMVA